MHELSITESVLAVVLRHAEANRARRVTYVDMLIGEISSFVDESIQMYWDLISKGTVAEGAQLRFRRELGTLYCLDCEKEFSIHEPEFVCPQCGGVKAKPGKGRECYVESIEIEEGEQ